MRPQLDDAPFPDYRPATKVSSSWPVALGLGLVTLLVASMIGFDFYFFRKVALQAAAIVEDAEQSNVLLDGIRFASQRLAAAGSGGDGERLRQEIDALVRVHAAATQSKLAALRGTYRRGILGNAVAGAIVLVLVALISVRLLRVLARQRRLVLRHAQFLEEKDAELEGFARRAAHDLRSPMNPIRGYADLILETPGLPENVASMAQRIRRSVDRLAQVVDDMLTLSTSAHPPDGHSASSAVVARVLEEMAADLQGIEVVTRLHGGQVRCAEATLSQIVRHLLVHAVKVRPRSRLARIVVETRDVGPAVEILVENGGVGSQEAGAKRAVEPLTRPPAALQAPGNGLGLAIVERTARALDGSCEVMSVGEQGTRLVVRLPRV